MTRGGRFVKGDQPMFTRGCISLTNSPIKLAANEIN